MNHGIKLNLYKNRIKFWFNFTKNAQTMLEVGNAYEIEFSFTQDQVNDFCKISGDFNPLHWDEAYAATTPFKKPIIHGALIASVFSRVMGMKFPGEGSVYLKQISEFKRPLFVGTTYKAKFEIVSTNPAKHTAEIATQVFELERGKLMVDGMASAMHATLF
jgi:acyl dehydratase